MNKLLVGVVGSTAYGLAKPDSDVDRLGVYAADTSEFHGLHLPIDKRASHVTHEPDVTMHEARKYCQLALRCNPTILELLWLNRYEHRDVCGQALVSIRDEFLSRKLVRDAYFEYAVQQFERLQRRENGTFSSDTAKRTAKHARHLYRLLVQGFDLYQRGTLTVTVSDPELIHDFGDQVAERGAEPARKVLATYELLFDSTTSVLPDAPNVLAVDRWLRWVRRMFWSR
jgi:predicted nucleotidyltransferase